MPCTAVSAHLMRPLPTVITNTYHASSRYSFGPLYCEVGRLKVLKSVFVLKNQVKAVDTQVGLAFQWSGCLFPSPRTTKGAELGVLGLGT